MGDMTGDDGGYVEPANGEQGRSFSAGVEPLAQCQTDDSGRDEPLSPVPWRDSRSAISPIFRRDSALCMV